MLKFLYLWTYFDAVSGLIQIDQPLILKFLFLLSFHLAILQIFKSH